MTISNARPVPAQPHTLPRRCSMNQTYLGRTGAAMRRLAVFFCERAKAVDNQVT
jgi:hypothetical protein